MKTQGNTVYVIWLHKPVEGGKVETYPILKRHPAGSGTAPDSTPPHGAYEDEPVDPNGPCIFDAAGVAAFMAKHLPYLDRNHRWWYTVEACWGCG